MVKEAYGDIIEGMSFDFSDDERGEVSSVGGPVGASGLLLSDYEITKGLSTFPGGDFFKFECPVNGMIVERQGEDNYPVADGGALLSVTRMTKMAFRPAGRTMKSLSMNVPFETLSVYLAQCEEDFPEPGRTVATGDRKRIHEARLAGILRHVAEFYEEYSRPGKRADLAAALLLDYFTSYLVSVDVLDWQNLIGLRRQSKMATRDAKVVSRAEDYMRAHFRRPISMSDIAAATGVSLRKLQALFREHRQCTLSDYRARVRLQAARQILLNPDNWTTVTSAALDSGITHLGRFSWIYKDFYGENPSETLVRSRRRH